MPWPGGSSVQAPGSSACPLVTTLLIELARLHGISEAAERTNHGLPEETS